MVRAILVFAFATFVCNFSSLHCSPSKCDKWKKLTEKRNPRFKTQAGGGRLTCHELSRTYVSKCDGHMLVPKRGKSGYSEAISDRMTSMNHNVTWRIGNAGEGCGYRKNVQCTWRFPVKSGDTGHVLFWRTELEYHHNCTNDYIVVDVFVDKRVSHEKVPANCVSVPKLPHHCRIEYKLGCGSFCDPTFTECRRPSVLCKDQSSSCDQTSSGGVFRLSTAQPELSSLKIDYMHVTFVSDSSATCSGFEGMFTAFRSGWSGAVNFGIPPTENGNPDQPPLPFDKWLRGQKDYIQGYNSSYRPDFTYAQNYSSEDRIRILAHGSQDTKFLDKLKKHSLFGPIVQGN